MKEHWALIVSRPDQANLDKFVTGDFISVSLKDSRDRLRDIAGESISDSAFESFRVLSGHRNKAVHFFHGDLERSEEAKNVIIAAQCRSWFYLHHLLRRWVIHFGEFETEIVRADDAMKQHRLYLKTKFETLKPELDGARQAGNIPRSCSACGLASAIPDSYDDVVMLLECLVCDYEAVQVKFDCPYCGKSTVVDEGWSSCERCEKSIEPEDLANALVDHAAAHLAFKDGGEDWELANCSSCGGYQTAVRRGENYFCTSCFNFFDHVEQCQWCHEWNTGDMGGSYAIGCGHCGGLAEHRKDD